MFQWSKICTSVLIFHIGLSSALFENCNNSYYNSNPNRLYVLNSPNYPNRYDPGTSCLFTITVPEDYEIVANCTVSIPKGRTRTSCTTDLFFISRDGDLSLNGAHQICGSGNLTRTSLFNKIAIAYTSKTSSSGGYFSCKLITRPQACDCGWSSQPRIVGGESTMQYEYPSIVSLRLKRTREHVCGGTIINHRYIATAAHCTQFFEEPQNIFILAGYYEKNNNSQFTSIYEAQEFINYPDDNCLAHDIALIKTKRSIEWSRYIGPICLPFDQVNNNFDNYTQVDVVGWGTISFAGPVSKTLQKAEVYVIPNSDCPFSQPYELCTFNPGRDACQRDSGGPVVLKGSLREYLVGIISRGNACAVGPGINIRTTSYLEWIYRTTNGSLCYKPFN